MGSLGWIFGKYWEGDRALEQAPWGSIHGPKPAYVQEAFGQLSWMACLTYRLPCVESGV